MIYFRIGLGYLIIPQIAHLLTYNDSLLSECEIFAIKTGPQPVLLAINTYLEFPRYLTYGAEVPIVTEAPFVDRCAPPRTVYLALKAIAYPLKTAVVDRYSMLYY